MLRSAYASVQRGSPQLNEFARRSRRTVIHPPEDPTTHRSSVVVQRPRRLPFLGDARRKNPKGAGRA